MIIGFCFFIVGLSAQRQKICSHNGLWRKLLWCNISEHSCRCDCLIVVPWVFIQLSRGDEWCPALYGFPWTPAINNHVQQKFSGDTEAILYLQPPQYLVKYSYKSSNWAQRNQQYSIYKWKRTGERQVGKEYRLGNQRQQGADFCELSFWMSLSLHILLPEKDEGWGGSGIF